MFVMLCVKIKKTVDNKKKKIFNRLLFDKQFIQNMSLVYFCKCCVMKCVIASVDILKLDRLTLLWIVNLALYFISVVTFSDADQCFMQIF